MNVIKSFFLILFVSLFIDLVNAQDTNPPPPAKKSVTTIVGANPTPEPPPKLLGESDEKSWKEFVDEDTGFKVMSIGMPTRTESKQEHEYGNIQTTGYSWKTAVAQYQVFCVEYPFLPTDSESIQNGFEVVKAGFEKSGLTVIAEKELSFDKYLGREFILEVLNTRLKTRLFYVGNKRYQIIFASAADNIKSKAFLEFYERTANKFLDSFKLTDSANAKAALQIADSKLPNPFDSVDLRGKIENSVYTNDFMSFSFKIPEKWVIESEDEAIYTQEKGFELMSKGNAASLHVKEVAKKNVRNLIGISKYELGMPDNTNLTLAVERLPFKSMTSEVYVSLAKRTMKEALKNIESFSDTKFKKIGGKDFSFFDANVKAEQLKITVRYLAYSHKGMALVMVFSFSNEKELEFLEQIINSFSFKQ